MKMKYLLFGLAAVLAGTAFWADSGHVGAKSAAVSLDDGSRFVFVPSRTDPEVSVLDTARDEIVATLKLDRVASQVVVSDSTGRLAASNIENKSLTIVDLRTHQLLKTMALDLTPERMVISPDGYLVGIGDAKQGVVAVVSILDYREMARVGGFVEPTKLTFGLDGSQLYVTDSATNRLALIDVVQNKRMFDIPVAPTNRRPASARAGVQPPETVSALTRTPDGRYGFVANAQDNTLKVIDLSTEKVIRTLQVGRAPLRPYGTADGRLMLVPNEGDATVSVVDTTMLQVVATLPGGRGVQAINTGWFESLALVVSAAERKLVLLDLVKFQSAGEIPLPGKPGPGVVTPGGDKLYVALTDADKIAVIDV
ncbi:MAG: hypothetical protein HYU75_16455, partial [Betaproteobacteria bacterium]|nr:hypothetical protein [Betaproteobacteria bacterium]